ncbi:MAG: phosphate ABC transporter permease PstA [Candidatus Melainabacteria bacterium]|nr:phosphate ABC transporter permease PstA [Candidatus Melainabacteria bacterium]
MAQQLEKKITQRAENISRIQSEQNIALSALWFSGWTIVAVLIFIIGYIFYYGLPYALSWHYLFSPPEGGRHDTGGILYQLVGTIYLVFGAILVAAPVGISTAVYLTEYAPQNLITKTIRFAIENLAGIPSIIYGLFGLAFFVIFLKFEYSLIAGALTVAIMILPVIIRTSEEALKTVPQTLRQSSLALGVNKWQTISNIVLPSAFPGILTGILLSVGRIIGESAILILATGGSITAMPDFISSKYPYFLPDSARTLAVHLYYQATSYDTRAKAFATGVVLVLFVLILNYCINQISKRYRRKYVR